MHTGRFAHSIRRFGSRGVPTWFLLFVVLPTHSAAACEPDASGTASWEQEAQESVQVPPITDRAARFYRTGMTAWGLRVIVGFLVPTIILITGFSATLRRLSHRVTRGFSLGTKRQRELGVRFEFGAAVFAGLYATITALVLLPLEWYQFFYRHHEFGLSNQSFGRWFFETLMTFGLGTAVIMLIAPVVYFFLQASPKRWWLYTSVGAVVTILALRIVFPVWIAPLYDDFGPMQDQALEQEIIQLADRAGIDGSRIYEVNKSQDTEVVNAYVTGLLNTKRVVLWDTLLEKLSREQVLFVMGHEMGHYAMHHMWKIAGVTGLLVLFSLYVVQKTAGSLIAKFRDRFGFSQLSDYASIPLLVLMVSVVSAVASPLSLAYSRHLEKEADRFGLDITRDNHAAATTWLALQRENLSNPDPGFIYRTWRATHPVLKDRVRFANEYRPRGTEPTP